jgi:hypothetical protein
MIPTSLKIFGTAAVVGFGTTAAVRISQRPSGRPTDEIGPSPEEATCVDVVWTPAQPLDKGVAAQLPLRALLTLAQFPSFHLTVDAQADALDALEEYFSEVEEEDLDGGTVLTFPGVEGSSIPEDGMDVGIKTALERVENYRRFGAAAAGSVVAPDCTWPHPFSRDISTDAHEAAVWQSLEQLAVVVLARRDARQIRVDVDPTGTVLDDRLEACVGDELMLPLRAPTTPAPELSGDADDESWQLTHETQVRAYQELLAALSNPLTTAPVSRVVAALAPRCPWGDKQRYGLRMTMLWYDVRRLERLADAAIDKEKNQ